MQDFDSGYIKFIKYKDLFKDDIFYLKLRYIFCFAEKETIVCKDGINSVKSSLNSYPFRLYINLHYELIGKFLIIFH